MIYMYMAQITKKDVREAVDSQVEKEFLANAEKRIKEYDENVIVLSHDEAEKFAYLLNEMIKSFKIGDYMVSI